MIATNIGFLLLNLGEVVFGGGPGPDFHSVFFWGFFGYFKIRVSFHLMSL